MHLLVNAELADIERTFRDIVADRGYSFQEHFVKTRDGYILSLFRIPGKLVEAREIRAQRQNGKFSTKTAPPVLLVHGIQDSADAWVVNDEESPAFILSNAGYDVWLANFRGNKYSKLHTSLEIMTPEYWDFGWEELAL